MPEVPPNPELMRSLGRLVRGLSALFWGLPTALVVCFHTAKADGFKLFGIVPPMACTGLLVYGLWHIGAFQTQERVWRNSVDRALLLSIINFGLSPFLYWHNRVPSNIFFLAVVLLLTASALLFLTSLNLVLQRLGAMLPDETLRLETRQFTALNLNLLLATFMLGALFFALRYIKDVPAWVEALETALERGAFWLLVLLVLLPLAMTMALIWKTKEVILESIFGPKD